MNRLDHPSIGLRHQESPSAIVQGLVSTSQKFSVLMGLRPIYPLVIEHTMTNSSPWLFDGPNRNRWFTELSMVDLSMANRES